jgi:hypothetical protein
MEENDCFIIAVDACKRSQSLLALAVAIDCHRRYQNLCSCTVQDYGVSYSLILVVHIRHLYFVERKGFNQW